MENTFTLTKTTLKNGKFQYVVTDSNNNVISKRTSSREYVACTADGMFYFGRLDLIGKGNHRKYINYAVENINMTEQKWEKISKYYTYNSIDEFKSWAINRLNAYNQIAYLNQ